MGACRRLHAAQMDAGADGTVAFFVSALPCGMPGARKHGSYRHSPARIHERLFHNLYIICLCECVFVCRHNLVDDFAGAACGRHREWEHCCRRMEFMPGRLLAPTLSLAREHYFAIRGSRCRVPDMNGVVNECARV